MGWKAAEKIMRTWKIVRGDKVMINQGKDKGQVGVITKVLRNQNRVIVEGKNLVKKHIKKTNEHPGGIFSIEAPLHYSNVQAIDPVTGNAVRIGIRYLKDGTKVRVTQGRRASGSILPTPDASKMRKTPRVTEVGPRDTVAEDVLERTYFPEAGRGLPEI